MNDKTIIACCPINKKTKLIKYRKFAKSSGFYISVDSELSYRGWKARRNTKSYPALFCPFCGKDFQKLSSLI